MKLKQMIAGRTYRITGRSEYFKDKYGTSNPLFTYEGTDQKVWGESWYDVFNRGNPAAVCFKLRMEQAGRDMAWDEEVLYGKVHLTGTDARLGELVVPEEIEEIDQPRNEPGVTIGNDDKTNTPRKAAGVGESPGEPKSDPGCAEARKGPGRPEEHRPGVGGPGNDADVPPAAEF